MSFGRVFTIVVSVAAFVTALFWRYDVAISQQPKTIPRAHLNANEQAKVKQRVAFELISKSTSQIGWNEPNPVAVIRAVNHLHSLGKNGAIEALLGYLKHCPDPGAPVTIRYRKDGTIVPDFANRAPIDASLQEIDFDQQRFCVIIPLLFVPTTAGAELPSLGFDPKSSGGTKWDNFWMSLEGNLPFHDVYFAGSIGGPDPGRGYLLAWAADHARLRETPLRPVDDPLKAADDLCEKLRKQRQITDELELNQLKYHIHQQAWRTIAHLIPSERDKNWPGSPFADDQKEWSNLKIQVAKFHVHWNEKEQDYTTK